MKEVLLLVMIFMTATVVNKGEKASIQFERHKAIVQHQLEEELKRLAELEEERINQSMEVTVTAYNSVEAQCDSDPWIAAWNDRLEPGMSVIAVSRDLERLGLTRGTEVCIQELGKTFIVMDRMNSRWKNRIDIWMEEDISAARKFGKQKLTIAWNQSCSANI